MLMTLSEAAKKLDETFSDAPFDASEFLLSKPGASSDELEEVERQLALQLPPTFRSILLSYGVGGVQFSSIRLGRDPYAEYLLDENHESANVAWWGGDGRPPSSLLIGTSDAYTFLLNVATENVLAFRHGEPFNRAVVIASDFELFLRGIATVFFERNHSGESVVARVTEEVKADTGQFWSELQRGIV